MAHETHMDTCPVDRDGYCNCLHCPIPCEKDLPALKDVK